MKQKSCVYASIVIFGAFTMAQVKNEEFEERILHMLEVEEFKQERREILEYGDRVLPVLEKILAQPEKFSERHVGRALGVARDMGSKASILRPLVQRQFQSGKALIRMAAVEALASIGNTDDLPGIVAMLYDPQKNVRYQAVKAMGKLGDESALLALEIWQKQAIEADTKRALQEKWIIGSSLIKEIDEAKSAIKRRIENKPMD